MLVCLSCARPVIFGPGGWVHRDPDGCADLRVAWPPPSEDDEADDEHAA